MRKVHIIAVLLLILSGLLAVSGLAFAESYSFKGACKYDGEEIVSNFTSDEFAASQSSLEPGDSLDYTVKYKNESGEPTLWYMKNTVLETLEESVDAAENGGYTYQLINVGPDGTETVLFDNDEVGGETKPADLEGLKQATNATGEYFYIQKLKAGETGITKLHVALDGETEVNDYMDTRGALEVTYAVENDTTGPNKDKRVRTVVQKTHSKNPRTGDPMDMLRYILMMVAAVIVGLLAFFSWRRDKKRAAAEAAGGIAEVDIASPGAEQGDRSLDEQMNAVLDAMERRVGRTDGTGKDGEA